MTTQRLRKHLNFLLLDISDDFDGTIGSEEWKRIGKSTEWTDTMNPITTTYDFIEDESPTNVTENYHPSLSVPLTIFMGDPVYDYFFDIYHNQMVDKKAYSRMLRVFQNPAIAPATGFKAQYSNVTIIIDNFNFATGVITSTITQAGSVIPGSATVTLGADGKEVTNAVFTPSEVAA